jgi:hypothetical protein
MTSPQSRPVVGKLATSVLALLLASCGGSSSGDPYTGLLEGTFADNHNMAGMVLDDGEYYLLYSQPGKPDELSGMVRGTDFQAASVTSADADAVEYPWPAAADYRWPLYAARPGALAVRVGEGGMLDGQINGRSFSATPVPDAALDARLADLTGAHSGTVVFVFGPRPAVFNVDESGNVSTVINDCVLKGKVVPMAEVNAYHLEMTFGVGTCVFGGATFRGVTFFDRDQRKLHAAVTATLPTFGKQAIGFIGTRLQQR